jgi:hypothetical protein
MAEFSTVEVLCVGHGDPVKYGAYDALKRLAA